MGEEIEGTAHELEPVTNAPPATLWRTDDPAEILLRAKKVADALAPVIKSANLVSNISGKEYLKVEAWQTLGQQVGVTPVVTETHRLSGPDGWEARCEARTLDGRVIGAADSMCLRSEERWKDSDDFEIRSMAQTRAMSRALASVLRFIPTLAGFSGTPAEEMQGKGDGNAGQARGGGGGASSGGARVASEAQRKLIFGKWKGAGGKDENELRAIIKWICDVDSSAAIPMDKVGQVKDKTGLLGAVMDREATIADIHDASNDTDRPDAPEAREIVDKYLSGGQQGTLGGDDEPS
jgi:hypothetical protein